MPRRTNVVIDSGPLAVSAAPGSRRLRANVATHGDHSPSRASATPTRSAGSKASRHVAIGQCGSVLARSSSS
jgi:hypothetical protein